MMPLQHKNLHGCLEAARAKCHVINSPNSIAVETLAAKESVVLSWKDSAATSAPEREWLSTIQQFLDR